MKNKCELETDVTVVVSMSMEMAEALAVALNYSSPRLWQDHYRKIGEMFHRDPERTELWKVMNGKGIKTQIW